MAAFFPSFWGSDMPKRLLRYVLQRVDYLEDEALDLEKLDLAIGRESFVEFRDVGIKHQKLEKLLKLPPTMFIQKAKVLNLRMTIPVDLWSSPVRVEMDGIDVRLRMTAKEDKSGHIKHKRKVQADDEEVIPSAEDLAQSFLATQSSDEKKRIEEALASEAQDLGASIALSEADSDDDVAFGTGQALTLPAFMTDIILGIVDNCLVQINHVTFQVDVEVPVESNAATTELITVQLAMDELSVEGLTTATQMSEGAQKIVHKHGKRQILLGNIRALLISEANVFSSLARSSSMPSSVASESPVLTASRPLSRPPTNSDYAAAAQDPVTSPIDMEESQYLQQDSEDAFNIPWETDEPSGDGEERGEPTELASSLSTPRASVHLETSPSRLEPDSPPDVLEPERAPWAAFGGDERPEDEPIPSFSRHGSDRSLPRTPSPQPSVHHSSASDISGSHSSDDLAQSWLYSHEEAESMYMSAFSQAQSRTLQSVPGSWHDDSREQGPPSDVDFASITPASPLNPRLEPSVARASISSPSTPQQIVPPTPAVDRSSTGVDVKVGKAETVDIDAQQEDVPTPRGSARLIKEIMSLDSISVYIPSFHRPHTQLPAPDLGNSASPHVPGAFFVHSAAANTPELGPVAAEPSQPSQTTPDKSIEIDLAPLEIRFDASLGFLLATLLAKLFQAFQAPHDATAAPNAWERKASGPVPDIKLTIEALSVLFLEKVTGVADTPQRHFAPEKVDRSPDVLLKARIEKIAGTLSQNQAQKDVYITLDRFTFGYANDDILFFDQRLQMFESVMNTIPEAGEDVSIKLDMTADNTRCRINTLPLHVKVDLLRLDETFSWFGGLSGFLTMSSSMTSSATKGMRSPVKVQKSRGVRFEAPINPHDQSAAKENKIDLRVNGFRLDLIGKECSLTLDTSALKMIRREEAVGVHFSRIRLSGPFLPTSRANPSFVLDVLDTRLEYLVLPRHTDLERLVELVTPSKVKFDGDSDEIMVDTLLKQRKKGSVLRLTLDRMNINLHNLEALGCLPGLGEDLAKLGTVAKYLPEDDRPGLLTLGLVKNVDCTVEIGGRLGSLHTSLKDVELAHITLPSLVAVAVGTVMMRRNQMEELVNSPDPHQSGAVQKPPVMMVRMVDDIEPVLKIKLMGLAVEYRVPAIMDLLGLAEDATPQDFEAGLASSVAHLGEHAQKAMQGAASQTNSPDHARSKALKVDVAMRDCLIGLNPLGLTSKLIVALTDARLEAVPGTNKAVSAVASVRKASLLLIDDVAFLDPVEKGRFRPKAAASSAQVMELCSKGFVDICQISSARIILKVAKEAGGDQVVHVHIRDDLLVLETCADSTQTLISLANALKPPTPPSKEIKYRTSVVPVEDLLASITADAFGRAEGEYDFEQDFALAHELGSETGEAGSEDSFFGGGGGDRDRDGEDSAELDCDSHLYEEAGVQEPLFDATAPSMLSEGTPAHDASDVVLLAAGGDDGSTDDLAIKDSFFDAAMAIEGTAHKWNSKKNRYDDSNDRKVQKSPVRVLVRDVHVIWNLFDGYDWARTRDVITKAVQDVEAKAHERRARADRRGGFEDAEDAGHVVGDFLFNSIYIEIPATRDPGELAQAINQGLHDNATATETDSVAATTVTNTTIRPGGSHAPRPRPKKLRLRRSKHHKITFELRGFNLDLVTFPPGSGETMSTVDVRVKDLVIFDHVPTSTWKKFAMYDQDVGDRELGEDMVHLELISVRPVLSLPATEMVVKAKVLPLRLHVDQDALDFITRFFEFKDDAAPPTHASPSDVPFVQRFEIANVPVRLDFKPKRVDYTGLRSGRTTEFMNFIVLEGATMTLRRTILYGVSGFDRLGQELNDIWMANVKATQLPGILAGLAPVRSLVDAGSGFRHLVEIPIREYRRDGRLVRGIGKGAAAFAKTTGTEVVKLGAKLAIGTQYALQGAEGLLAPAGQHPNSHYGEGPSFSTRPATPGENAADDDGGWDVTAGGRRRDDDDDDDEAVPEQRKQISLYADQPLGIVQGVRGAYASLSRDLAVARDAIIAVPGEVMESTSAQEAARAVLRRAPTIVFRPAIGATKAIGQTLLGATNALDPENRRRMEAKYKRH